MKPMLCVLVAMLALPNAYALAVAPPGPPAVDAHDVTFHLRVRVGAGTTRLNLTLAGTAVVALAPSSGDAGPRRALHDHVSMPVDVHDPRAVWHGWSGVYDLALTIPRPAEGPATRVLGLSTQNATVLVPLAVPPAPSNGTASGRPPSPAVPTARPGPTPRRPNRFAAFEDPAVAGPVPRPAPATGPASNGAGNVSAAVPAGKQLVPAPSAALLVVLGAAVVILRRPPRPPRVDPYLFHGGPPSSPRCRCTGQRSASN